jgi:hypothetical protein
VSEKSGGAAAKDIGRGLGVAGFSPPLLPCALCALLRLISVFIRVHPWFNGLQPLAFNFSCHLPPDTRHFSRLAPFVTLLFNFRFWVGNQLKIQIPVIFGHVWSSLVISTET